ncbi:BTAD domain-containing putative transcriptional regulator [Cryptosporangium phraense]|uniref:Bacterial transcriptional activator domain-containing protein n=1 Tax=Cryptosporangium phraense TaxID=2593070 RepID=A0A545B2L5_9ACTN|nr:BTAD domain-containing putative transcriptional regulator [Cryptosporangium phraense]TQS47075.1 hypothetical protein FL583_02100 [Cryptosporangium phraense]
MLDASSYTVIAGPSGSYLAERLASALAARNRWNSCVWLRGPRPSAESLAVALSEACATRWGDGGPPAGSGSRRLLERAMLLAPPDAVVVLETTGRVTAAIGRLMTDLRPLAVERGIHLVVATEGRQLPLLRYGPDALVPPASLWPVGELPTLGAGLSPGATERIRRRPAVAADLLEAASIWPADVIADALRGRRWPPRTLDHVTAALLELCTPAQRSALELSVLTGYWHPQLDSGVVSATDLRPWLVPLEQSWGWLRPIWRGPLRRALAQHGRHRGPVHRSALPARASPVRTPAPPADAPPRPARPPGQVVQARLFGGFELRVDGVVVDFAGRRGVSVLRFLLARPQHSCPRDQLLEEFWPDVDQQTSRNRLQVAISGLRTALRGTADGPVLEFAAGMYRIAPSIRLSTDVDEFEAALGAAHRAEQRGQAQTALAAYHEAIDLYRGDFAADVPYESWTLLPRESLRLRYLDALDRTSDLALRAGRVDDCIVLAHRVLDVDPCREETHRLLMRCYARQGRTHQALRQYELCRRLLAATLSVPPMPETTALYDSIRSGPR